MYNSCAQVDCYFSLYCMRNRKSSNIVLSKLSKGNRQEQRLNSNFSSNCVLTVGVIFLVVIVYVHEDLSHFWIFLSLDTTILIGYITSCDILSRMSRITFFYIVTSFSGNFIWVVRFFSYREIVFQIFFWDYMCAVVREKYALFV